MYGLHKIIQIIWTYSQIKYCVSAQDNIWALWLCDWGYMLKASQSELIGFRLIHKQHECL